MLVAVWSRPHTDHGFVTYFSPGLVCTRAVNITCAAIRTSTRGNFVIISSNRTILLGLFSRRCSPVHPLPFHRSQVVFDRDLLITHMVSPEGEQLKLVEAIDPKGQNVEGWMLELEGQMRLTVRRRTTAFTSLIRRTHRTPSPLPPSHPAERKKETVRRTSTYTRAMTWVVLFG